MPKPLPREFYDRNALHVAPDLVGCVLVRRHGPGQLRAVRITETEAYVGEHDLACHARAGRTGRTEVMYGPPGHAYIYLIYGLHHCLNFVCGPGNDANAVLIRAGAPLTDAEVRAAGLRALQPPLHSGVGPGNLCKALDLSRAQNTADVCGPRAPLFVLPRVGAAPPLATGPRIGVDYAGPWAKEPLRFCDAQDPHVSRPRPTPPRR